MESKTGPTLIVVAALIERDGRYLVAQRLPGDPFPGLWEFPGGKVEDAEAPEAALRRECMEELNIDIQVGRIHEVLFHSYQDFSVLLLFYDSEILSGSPQPIACERIAWLEAHRMNPDDFLPADRVLIERLRK